MKLVIPALLGAALLVHSGAASAGTKSFILNGSVVTAQTGLQSVRGPLLPDGATHYAYVNFTIPSDYLKNSAITIQPRLGINATGCSVSMSADYADRLRVGFVTSTVIGTSSGFSMVSVSPFAVPSAMKIFEKVFQLQPATGGGIVDQVAGDNVIVRLTRLGSAAGDTCASNLIVTTVKIIYTTP
jgi:hypothetical protein